MVRFVRINAFPPEKKYYRGAALHGTGARLGAAHSKAKPKKMNNMISSIESLFVSFHGAFEITAVGALNYPPQKQHLYYYYYYSSKRY